MLIFRAANTLTIYDLQRTQPAERINKRYEFIHKDKEHAARQVCIQNSHMGVAALLQCINGICSP